MKNIKKNKKKSIKRIITFIGRAGSGKDYQCTLLEEQGFKKLAFADALRDIASKSLMISDEELKEHYEWMKQNNCICVKTEKMTWWLNFRTFLERLGTNGIRKYDPDFWINCLLKIIEDNKYDKICISDMRFINEYIKIREFALNNNYEFKCIFCDYHSNRYQENNNHETAKLSNKLCEKGYKDLQEVQYEDIVD